MGTKKRVFVSFAIEDKSLRTMLRGQSRLGDCPIEYTDFSVKEPWDSSWKTNCRTRIRGCDAVIALLTDNVKNADGARWEIKCAVDEGVPLLGVYANSDRYKPPELVGAPVITWTWSGISNWIEKL